MNGLAYLGAVGVTGRLARLLLQFSLAILLSNTSITFAQNHVLQLDGKWTLSITVAGVSPGTAEEAGTDSEISCVSRSAESAVGFAALSSRVDK